jgi:hypothetical protein
MSVSVQTNFRRGFDMSIREETCSEHTSVASEETSKSIRVWLNTAGCQVQEVATCPPSRRTTAGGFSFSFSVV